MPPSDPLQQLRDLDGPSPRSPDQLANVLLGADWVDLAQGLQRDDLHDLVERLDRALDVLDPTSPAFWRCLSNLQSICAARELMPTSHILPLAPTDVGNRPVASGAVADVYSGTLDRAEVYVKKVRVYSGDPDPENTKILFREAVVWKRMVHPNIVPFYGVTLEPPQIVSDCMVSGDIPGFIREHPDADRLGLLCDVAEGLDYLHSRNVVHGAIMGTNVWVNRLGRVRLAEFALAAVDPDECLACGVMEVRENITRWTAPELLGGSGPLTKKADVFSFAMLMIEVFTGAIPFNGFRSVASAVRIMNGERPPRPGGATITNDVWALMEMCWEQERQSRPSMKGVLQRLTSCLLQSLYELDKSLFKFPAAPSQPHGSTGRGRRVGRLHDVESEDFVNLMDKVLHIEGLNEELVRLKLHHLREVCASWAMLPDSHVIPSHSPGSIPEHCTTDGRAEVWRGLACLGEEGNSAMDVCIKVVRPEKVHNGYLEVVAQWVRLDHPNILRCFGVIPDPLQIVTEWMPNGQAMQYAQERQDTDRVRLLVGIACGLDYLHSHGLVHGNLKQQNILVDFTGEVRLSDVGFAKLVPAGELGFDWVDAGVSGCRWAAPEVFRNGRLSEQSDVFSYGFVAAEIFTGNFIWEGVDVTSKVLDGKRPDIPEGKRTCTLTKEVWRVFTKCWEKAPDCRISVSRVLSLLRYLWVPNSTGGYLLLIRCIKQALSDPLVLHTFSKRSPPQLKGKFSQTRNRLMNWTREILETNMITPRERPAVLNVLCKMCYRHRSLPKSMTITCPLAIPATIHAGGGSANVYQVQYDGRTVAVKSIRTYVLSDQDLRSSRFCQEAVIWWHLRHPNILPLLGAVLDTQTPIFALLSEWMVNGTINDFVEKDAGVNRAQLLVDVAHGLEYIHCLNFVHGDLKGANILINENHRACLTDFGLSTIIGAAPVAARSSVDISSSPDVSRAWMDSKVSLVPHCSGGTIRWMSPEMRMPERFGLDDIRPTKQSDCYALGMVIYEVLCGKKPYWDHNGNITLAVLEGIRPSKPDAAATLGFTDGLWWTVECCWMADRDTRPDVKTVLSQLTHAAWAWDRRL